MLLTPVFSWAISLTGPLDLEALCTVVHETVRSRVVGPFEPPRVQDLSRLNPAEQENAISDACQRITAEFAADALGRARTAVHRLAPEHHIVLIATAGADAHSTSSPDALVGELSQRYRKQGSYTAAERPVLPPAVASSLDDRTTRWLDGLRGAERLDLPVDRPGGPPECVGNGVVARSLAPDLAPLLARRAALAGVAASHLVQAAFASWLHRHSGQRDLAFGVLQETPTTGRDGERGGVVPVRLTVDPRMTVTALAERCRSAVEAESAHALPVDRPLPSPGDDAGDSVGAPLRAIVTVARAPHAHELAPGVYLQSLIPPHHDFGTDLALTVELADDSAPSHESTGCLALVHRAGLLDRPGAARLLDRFEQLLRQSLTAPRTRIGDLSLVTPPESELIARTSRGPVRPFTPSTIPERFRAQVERHPGRPAVSDDQGGALTYAELDRRTDALAALLVERGVRPERRCAVLLDRGVEAVVALLATVKAGGAYVPVDPATPVDRMSALFDDATVDVVLTSTGLAPRLPDPAPRVLLLDELPAETPGSPAPAVPLVPGHLAYVIYTSGSTGRPKGVLVDHGSVTHFVDMIQEFFALSEQDRIAQCAALWFDVSVFEIFGALLTGASVHVAGDATKLTPLALHTMLRDHRVTALMTTPSLLEALRPEDLPDLRVMSIGGEPFTAELTNRWAPGRLFVNGYGPAEATVEVVAKVCTGTSRSAPPIGRPLANHHAHVLDERMRPVPIGVVGELYVGGPGVARGYLARPGLTASMFLPDPEGNTPGGRLYRTGDLVRRLPNGDLLYAGRVDRQVKIRGMRVELGEVEQALSRHPDVVKATAVASRNDSGDTGLVGYVVAANGATADDVKAAAAAWVPPYMVPGEIFLVDAIPTTTSGKVDVLALSAMAERPPVQLSAPPRELTRFQLAVGEIVREILGAESVSVDDDLFALGGNSLQVLRVLSRVHTEFGVLLTPQEFFEDPTTRGIAAAIDAEFADA
ncbi:amino acid adenylation domain-containing protein [Streptomyces sp. NPDC050164]|uniref:amino acid adenylation domain-containing protein n=1 Tax=Streptomyces sp. NPDC050164 TaxID=3365605 RepID=UPI0037B0FBA6